MMNESDIQEKIDKLKTEIEEWIRHAFLRSAIDFPVLDGEKLMMLYRMFREKDYSHEQIKTRITSVMLVQAALDVHDSVAVAPLHFAKDKQARQFTVLAGDYYSGLYYHLLAKGGDVPFVGHLAATIGQINEHKMYLHQSENETIERTFEHIRAVETLLLQKVADYFQMPLWRSFYKEYFLLRRLLAEKQRYQQSQSSPLLYALDNSKRKKGLFASHSEKLQQLPQVLDAYIDHAGKGVERLLLKSSRFETLFGGRIWDIFLKTGYFKQKLAEEG